MSKKRAITLEGDVVRAAALIAYVSPDIDDAFRAGMLKPSDAPPHVRVGFGRKNMPEALGRLDDFLGTGG